LSQKTSNASITIVRTANLGRDVVLFTFVGLSSTIFYPVADYTLLLLFLLVLDSIGFLLLLTLRDPLKQVGYVWAGLMSMVLMFHTSMYLGSFYFFSDVIMILLLSGIQLLALIKIGINAYVNVSEGDNAL
jgi:hypothetical protein